MHSIHCRWRRAAAAIAAAALSLPAHAGGGEKAVVLGVHSQESSAAFAARLGLPDRGAEGGRFAIVRLLHDGGSRHAFALVYVPPGIAVAQDDLVELGPADVDLVRYPGRGIVAGVRGHGGQRFSSNARY